MPLAYMVRAMLAPAAATRFAILAALAVELHPIVRRRLAAAVARCRLRLSAQPGR